MATKTAPLKRPRDFSCEFAFRDGPRLVKAFSRPGVFSHRELDVGARALLDSLSAPTPVVQPGMWILDLGCGSGGVGLALALRADGVHVHAVDSNPRALQYVTRGAELNGLPVLDNPPEPCMGISESSLSTQLDAEGRVQLDAEGRVPHQGSFDLVVANPP